MERARRAAPDDLPRCAELLAAARHEVIAGRGGSLLLSAGPDASAHRPAAGDAAVTVARWAGGERSLLLVGLLEDVVVGLVAGEAQTATGVITCCYVEPPARGVGVGSALTAAVVTWFAEQGCTGVDAWALPGDRSSKQLLETAGFSARLLVLHRRLP